MENGKLFTIISLVGGFIVGMNLFRLKKYLPTMFYKKDQTEFKVAMVVDKAKEKAIKPKEEVIKAKEKAIEPKEIKTEKPTEATAISAETSAETPAEIAETSAETKDIEKAKNERGKDMERSILDILKENPRGKTLFGLGKELRIPFIKLATPIENLLVAGKVVRNGNIYSLPL